MKEEAISSGVTKDMLRSTSKPQAASLLSVASESDDAIGDQ
jgi:hypothetical protein